MKRILPLVAAACWFSAQLFVSDVCAADGPIKIGAIFSVTGPASFLGEPEKNTAKMLEEEINKAGGLLGRFPVAFRQRITFEYVLLEGVNDAPEQAKAQSLVAGPGGDQIEQHPACVVPGDPPRGLATS